MLTVPAPQSPGRVTWPHRCQVETHVGHDYSHKITIDPADLKKPTERLRANKDTVHSQLLPVTWLTKPQRRLL